MKKYILGLAFLSAVWGGNVNAASKDWALISGVKQTFSLAKTYALDDKAIRGACVYVAMLYIADPVGDKVDSWKAKHWDNKYFNDAAYHTDDLAMISSVAPALLVAEQIISWKNKLLVPVVNGAFEYGARQLEAGAAWLRHQKIT